jgi:hypothetical protein
MFDIFVQVGCQSFANSKLWWRLFASKVILCQETLEYGDVINLCYRKQKVQEL